MLAIALGLLLSVGLSYFYCLLNIQEVPENYVWIMEFQGGFKVQWAAGGHMYFPLFNWFKHRSEIYLGERKIEIFPDSEDFIDMLDASCHFKAEVTIKVEFSVVATYNIDNYKEAVRSRVAGLMRHYFSKMTLNPANTEKGSLPAKNVISQNNQNASSIVNPFNKYFFKEILDDWGVRILKIILDDIQTPAEDIALRKKLQALDVEKKLAIGNKDIAITKSEGDAKAIENIARAKRFELEQEGLGVEQQAEALMKIDGAAVPMVLTLINERYKYTMLQKGTLIIDNIGGSIAGGGAKFGAGMKLQDKNNKQKGE